MKISKMKGLMHDLENALSHHLGLEFDDENASRGTLKFGSLP
jgi:hypothetical protein